MIDYSKFPNKNIACIDMKSFFASCAAVDRGIDVLKHPIAVVGNLNQKGSIVLAASPSMKKRFRVKTGTRLYEIPQHPDIILIEPRMEFFIKVSMEISRLLNQYVPTEAIHVYSVDECFFDLSGTERLWGPIEQTIKRIQDELLEQFQLPSAVGVGPNMLMSKLALDLDAKKTGYAKWTFDDVQTKLWPVSPLSEVWGIGSRTEKSLNDIGIYTVGDLAHTDFKKLEKKFGIMGNQYYHHAWGIDLSELGAPLLESQEMSYGKGQTLYRDYVTRESVLVVILEMCEDVTRRAREARREGRTVHLGIGYSKHALGGGFSRSLSIEEATNDTMKIYRTCMALFDKFHDGRPVRKITISITNLEDETSMQLSFFDEHKLRNRKLGMVMDNIRDKYGSTAILRAVSLTEDGTAIKRSKLVGGHK